MKAILLTSVVLIIFAMSKTGKFQEVSPSKSAATAPAKIMSGGCICFEIYEPICANDGRTYGNSCFLNCARRQNPFLLGLCEGECPCCKPPYQNEPLPEETGWGMPMEGGPGGEVPYEMMMGPYGNQGGGWPYKNEEIKNTKEEADKLEDVKLGFMSSSSTGATAENQCICTAIYRPVCGSNNQTYGNLCNLKCAAEKTTCLTVACEGECPCCSCNKNVVYSPPDEDIKFSIHGNNFHSH